MKTAWLGPCSVGAHNPVESERTEGANQARRPGRAPYLGLASGETWWLRWALRDASPAGPSANNPPRVTDACSPLASSPNIRATGGASWALQQRAGRARPLPSTSPSRPSRVCWEGRSLPDTLCTGEALPPPGLRRMAMWTGGSPKRTRGRGHPAGLPSHPPTELLPGLSIRGLLSACWPFEVQGASRSPAS